LAYSSHIHTHKHTYSVPPWDEYDSHIHIYAYIHTHLFSQIYLLFYIKMCWNRSHGHSTYSHLHMNCCNSCAIHMPFPIENRFRWSFSVYIIYYKSRSELTQLSPPTSIIIAHQATVSDDFFCQRWALLPVVNVTKKTHTQCKYANLYGYGRSFGEQLFYKRQ
jgi:hypothetical protein